MKALIWKNFLWMWRNVGVMAFIIGLPCLQIILFCWAIGHDPKGLKLAISNHEFNATSIDDCPVIEGCNYTLLSCRYLNTLRQKDMIIVSARRRVALDIFLIEYSLRPQQLFDSDEAAYEEVRRGRAWAAMIFQSNYSDSLVERTEAGRYAEDYTIEASDIQIKMDMSSTYLKLPEQFPRK